MDAIKTEQPFRWYYTEIDPRGVETYYKLCSDEAEVKALVARFGGTYFPLYLAQPALAQPAQPVAWQPCDRTLRVLARAFRKVAPHLIDEFINRAQEALLQEQDDDNQGNGGRTRGLAGKGDADHAGPAGQRNDEQHDDGAAERGAGLLRSLAHEDCGGGNAARVTEEGAVDAAPQPAPTTWTQEQIDAIHKDAEEIGSKARTPRLAAPAADEPCEHGAFGRHSWHTTEHGHDICIGCKRTRPSAPVAERSTDGGHRGLSDALRKGSGEKLSSWDRRSMSPPSTDAFEQECADIDAILGELGLDPERMRSEGGRLILSRIFEAIRAGRATVALPNLPTAQMIEAGIAQAFPHLTGIQPGDIVRIWQSMVIAARGKL